MWGLEAQALEYNRSGMESLFYSFTWAPFGEGLIPEQGLASFF